MYRLHVHVFNIILLHGVYMFTAEAESARLATVLQENAVLKSELDMLRHKHKNMMEENRRLRQASVNIVSY